MRGTVSFWRWAKAERNRSSLPLLPESQIKRQNQRPQQDFQHEAQDWCKAGISCWLLMKWNLT